jgi:hypothetical protein
MIGIFRRLNTTVPAPTDPGRYWPEPVIDPDREAAFAKALADLAILQTQIGRLRLELDNTRAIARREQRGRELAEQALRELSVARAGDAAATELHHTRRTLLQYEELLQGCRDKHGWNTTRSTLPAPPGAPA